MERLVDYKKKTVYEFARNLSEDEYRNNGIGTDIIKKIIGYGYIIKIYKPFHYIKD